MRLLVTGPRGWTDLPVAQHALLDARDNPPPETTRGAMLLVSGACPKGLDAMAEQVAGQWRWQIERHPADWNTYRGAAGFRRNSAMVALGADLCVAFALPCEDAKCRKPRPHLTHGTAHCAAEAKAAGIPVRWYKPRA